MLILFMMANLVLLQCSKKTMIRKYYVLEIEAPKLEMSLDSLQALPYRFEVQDMRIAKAYDQTRIALRSASHEMNYYFYHNWAVRPTVAIADLVYQTLKASGICPYADRGYMLNPDYVITGYIDQLERNEQQRPVAHVCGSLELRIKETDAPILNYRFNRELLLTNPKDMNNFAQAVSIILFEETQGFLRRVVKELVTETSGSKEVVP